jgi:hypothetical protein
MFEVVAFSRPFQKATVLRLISHANYRTGIFGTAQVHQASSLLDLDGLVRPVRTSSVDARASCGLHHVTTILSTSESGNLLYDQRNRNVYSGKKV